MASLVWSFMQEEVAAPINLLFKGRGNSMVLFITV